MNYVITGHRGWIGSRLTQGLTERGHTWTGLDVTGLGPDLTQPSVFERELSAALARGPVDAVIHLAAQPGRVFGQQRAEHTIRSNALMSYRVARACGELGVRLIYTSTSEVYGRACDDGVTVDETTPPQPINLYGMTKHFGEELSQLYAPNRLLIVRPTMPYGPGMQVGVGRAALPTFIYKAMSGETIEVHRDTYRSWCYVDDFIDAFLLVIEQGQRKLYNLGRDDDLISMREVAELAIAVVGREPSSTIVETEHDDSITPVKNISTGSLRALGFEPKVDLEGGMQRTYESMLTLIA